MTEQNYLSRKPALMRSFEKMMAQGRPGLLARYGEEQVEQLNLESRQEYEGLIGAIPYIGERNPLLVFLLPTSRHLAVYRTLQRHGRTSEEAGQVVYELGEAAIGAMPYIARRAIGALWFSSLFKRRLRQRAAETAMRPYPDGYVIEFVEGDGRTFDYGIDYIQCAGCKFLEAQGAMEMAPYACAIDKPASEMMGWGLTRTTTLAEGFERCDFRFKKGGKTCVPLPPALASLNEGNGAV